MVLLIERTILIKCIKIAIVIFIVELYLQFHLKDKKYFANLSKGYRNLLGI